MVNYNLNTANGRKEFETETLNVINNQFGKILKEVWTLESGKGFSLYGYERSYKKIRQVALDLARSGAKVKRLQTHDPNQPFCPCDKGMVLISFELS